MDKDPARTLISHFSHYVVDSGVATDDWELVTSEYGVAELTASITRFYESCRHGDDDQTKRVKTFLRKVYEQEGEETALAIMKRMYGLQGGADETEIQRYPALESLEGERTAITEKMPLLTNTTDQFLDIQNVPDDFYMDLVENINKCYRIGVYDGTFVLTRKFLENLMIDILRKDSDRSEIEAYYIQNQRRFRNFSTLLEEFEERLNVFQPISGGVDTDLLSEIARFKSSADAQAHSIEDDLTKEEVENLSNDAEHAAKVLVRVFRNLD